MTIIEAPDGKWNLFLGSPRKTASSPVLVAILDTHEEAETHADTHYPGVQVTTGWWTAAELLGDFS